MIDHQIPEVIGYYPLTGSFMSHHQTYYDCSYSLTITIPITPIATVDNNFIAIVVADPQTSLTMLYHAVSRVAIAPP